MTGLQSAQRSSSFIWQMRAFPYWKTARLIGLPVPEKLKEMLLQLTEEEHSQGGVDEDPPTGGSTDDDSGEM